jgi:HAE1 family hydrophobic/amphiphilic exporter-1
MKGLGLVRKAAEHPVSVLMLYAALFTLGLLCFFRLDRELLPRLPIPVARVLGEYAGIPAEEVERLLTIPLENALSSVKGVQEVSSVSKDELSAVTLRFRWGAEMERATVEVRERIDAVYPSLPFGARKPLVYSEDANDRPVLVLAVLPAEGRSLQEVAPLVRGELAALLRQVPGVGALRLVGLPEPEVLVEVDSARLYAAGLPLQALAAAIAGSVYEVPVGPVVENEREYLVRAGSEVDTLEELRRIPLPGGAGGALLTVGDFASVRSGTREPTSFFHYDGREAAGVFFSCGSQTGSLNAARSIRAALPPLQEAFQRELRLQVVEDPTREIEGSFRSLLVAIGLGIVSAFSVLMLIFRRARVPLIATASIPLAMTATFLFMELAQLTLNVVSLAGIAMGVGMIVDNSVVVLESLLRRQARSPAQIAAGTMGVASATFGSTVTTLLVFLPVLFLPGVTGALFGQLALTICILLLVSFLSSLTLTPALYRLLLPRRPAGGGIDRARWLRTLQRGYRRYLLLAFRRPLLPLGLLLFVLAAGALCFLRLPWTLLPEREPALLEVSLRLPAGTPTQLCLKRSLEVGELLRALPGVDSVFAEAGFDERSLRDRAQPGKSPQEIRYRLALAGGGRERGNAAGVLALIEEVLAPLQGVRHSAGAPPDPMEGLLGAGGELSLRLRGEPREALLEQAEALAAELGSEGLSREVEIDTRRERPRLDLALDPDALAFGGVRPAEVLQSLRLAVRGETPAALKLAGEPVDVRVRLSPEQTDSLPELARVRVPGGVGAAAGGIETGLLGQLHRTRSSPLLYRQQRKPAVTLTIRPERGMREALEARLRALPDEGAELLSVSRLREGQREILVVFLFALLLMYLVLGAQFESFLLPLLLLLSLPLSVSGSLALLLAWGYSLNLSSFLGVLILLGTAMNIAILLSTAYGAGGPAHIVAASVGRLRPVAATVLTTVVALVPIAANRSAQGSLQGNTAVALIGGLAAGAVAILLLFPLLYSWSRPRRRRRRP